MDEKTIFRLDQIALMHKLDLSRELLNDATTLFGRLWKEINWNRSAISADTIKMLNEIPIKIQSILLEMNPIGEEDNMEGLTVGRMVHYVAYGTPKGEYPQGAHRAAIVTEVLNEAIGEISLCVLNPTGIFFKEDIFYSKDTTAPGTWHWIERELEM